MGIAVKTRSFNMKYHEWIDQGMMVLLGQSVKQMKSGCGVNGWSGVGVALVSIRLVAAVPLLANFRSKSVHLDM
jgi:hypothetical protein